VGNDAITYRCEIGADNIVEFGPVGSLVDLAGPVSQMQFTCYDVYDLDTPITTVDDIRSVNVQIALTNPGPSQDRNFTTQAYLRTNSGDLIGHWKLDETSGTTAADSSDNGNDGTLENMAGDEWTTGVLSGALQLDGNNDHIEVTGLLGEPADITICAWVNLTSIDLAGADVVSLGDCIAIRLDDTNPLRGCTGMFFDGSDLQYTPSADYIEGTGWHQVAYTFDDSANTQKFYIDGVEEGSSTHTDSVSYSGQGSNVTMGIHGNGSANYSFGGLVDDVRIYNRALTADDVAALASVPIYRGFTEAKSASETTSITISTPASNEGDLLIAAVATDGDTASTLAPPGGESWTEIDLNDYSSAVTLGAWWKNAGASESASHQFTWTGDEGAYGWMMRFRGHDPADPVDVYTASGETGPAPTSPAATTNVVNCLILRMGAFDDGDITVDSPGLSGHTAITMDKSDSDSGQVTYEEFTEAKQSSPSWNITISTPSGTSEGDLLIAIVVIEQDDTATLAPPAGEGWNQISIDHYGSSSTRGVTVGAWWKNADASESASHQFTWTRIPPRSYGWIMRFTGHDSTTPIDDYATYGETSSTPTSPSVTTTVADCLILRTGRRLRKKRYQHRQHRSGWWTYRHHNGYGGGVSYLLRRRRIHTAGSHWLQRNRYIRFNRIGTVAHAHDSDSA
jgi:hypothetical protein